MENKILSYNKYFSDSNISEKKNTPSNKSLWDKAIRLAKGKKNGGSSYVNVDGKRYDAPNNGQGFSKYPSAYGNSYAAKMYKKWGGTWKTNESVSENNIGIYDLIGKKYIKFIHGNSEESSIKPLTKDMLSKHIENYVYQFIDWDFYYNIIDDTDEFLSWFNKNKMGELRKIVLNNLKIEERKYIDGYTVSLNLNNHQVRNIINKIMLEAPEKFKNDYINYWKEFTNINLLKEDLRDWYKEEWVRINTKGDITGDCGTMKNKERPSRCLPKKKAQSLTKQERIATVSKKKTKGKNKQFVPNTKKSKVSNYVKTFEYFYPNSNDVEINANIILKALEENNGKDGIDNPKLLELSGFDFSNIEDFYLALAYLEKCGKIKEGEDKTKIILI